MSIDRARGGPDAASLGTLGFHVDGRPCRVGCAFCYLGARPEAAESAIDPDLVAAAAGRLPVRDLAISVSEPAALWRPHVEALAEVARARGLLLAATTTVDVARTAPWLSEACGRLTLSVDPAKGKAAVTPAAVAATLAAVARPGLEVVLLVTLATPAFCKRLTEGLLAEFLAIDAACAVALNGIKPPPPWCDRAFWRRLLAAIAPLLDVHLGTRLHLDCYVSARILGLSDCPKKPDIAAGREFRACVYQREPDFVFDDPADLAARVATYRAPARCPFPIV